MAGYATPTDSAVTRSVNALLDLLHANLGAGKLAFESLCFAPEIVVCNNGFEPIHMDNMVYLRLTGYQHRQISVNTSANSSGFDQRDTVDSASKLTTKQFSVDFIACTSKILGNSGYNRAQGADMHVPMTRDRHPVFGALSGSGQHHVTAFLPDEPVAIVMA